VKCTSRVLSSIYAISFLILFVKVQLNIIGAHLFLINNDKQQNDLLNINLLVNNVICSIYIYYEFKFQFQIYICLID
jgi:hypothetical protein